MKLCIHYSFSNKTTLSNARIYLNWQWSRDTPITKELLDSIERELRKRHEESGELLTSLFLTNWQIVLEAVDCEEFAPMEIVNGRI